MFSNSLFPTSHNMFKTIRFECHLVHYTHLWVKTTKFKSLPYYLRSHLVECTNWPAVILMCNVHFACRSIWTVYLTSYFFTFLSFHLSNTIFEYGLSRWLSQPVYAPSVIWVFIQSSYWRLCPGWVVIYWWMHTAASQWLSWGSCKFWLTASIMNELFKRMVVR